MLHNYHTHTTRCNHANNSEREYIEIAIQKGMKTLGFSDHAPYLFPFKDYYSSFRMRVDELEEYADTIRSLAKEYEKDIRILCGFELEYYPDYHKEKRLYRCDSLGDREGRDPDRQICADALYHLHFIYDSIESSLRRSTWTRKKNIRSSTRSL